MFKMKLNAAKQKYCGSFNKSVVRQQVTGVVCYVCGMDVRFGQQKL